MNLDKIEKSLLPFIYLDNVQILRTIRLLPLHKLLPLQKRLLSEFRQLLFQFLHPTEN